MFRFVAIAVALLFAASVVAVGMGESGTHSVNDGQVHVAEMAAQDLTGHPDGPSSEPGPIHMSCAVGGHSCSGFIAPALGIWTLRSIGEPAWIGVAQQTVAGLSPEATTPPPRV